ASVEVRVRGRGSVVPKTVEQVHGHAIGKSIAEIAGRLVFLVGPSAVTDEGRREHDDRPKLWLGRLLRERPDEERPANRMTDDHGSVVERRDLPLDRRAPPVVARVALGRHPRVAHVVLVTKLTGQAVDELVLPGVVD